ncbi:protein CHLOROPLAST IMPORT APPARATUS 2-like [Neltuma alba]|uniref:protein CHLOROPLAST IMPORT APPARATUS 2-like n=1 Tax=Neltuma alba TaxID=207710 RepID=UPI0010A5673A|nr:protein CHLOROPLAST IMPORT APPARATUS 2-like [Prosopis alba]XP_028768957.1 protein CHLOROPLAST IMPORT APPARATUS 2-like [Prosopis alba]XP_028792446.1 protein CHLOROPLAST IMPORT APPARATUS 2-like [Prosopis alba]
MEYNSLLRSPKKEERQVPEYVFPVSPDFSNHDFNVLDELGDGVLCSEQDHRKLQNSLYGSQLNWDFMELEGFSAVDAEEPEVADDDEGEEEDEEEEEKRMRSKCLVEDDKIIKRENGGLWEEDDEKMTSLKLSLNYQEVLDAWSDRGPLWADDCSLSMPSNVNNGFCYMGEVPTVQEDRSRRNASVRRYKEKRQSRLFSKKIRYQVRKLNADKRPRIKGRFVKRL